MKYIFFIICSIILPIFSVKVTKLTKPKLCINCKYFIPDNDNGLFSKCSLFPLKEGEINFLVNGINEEKYSYCTTSRSFDHMCGQEGKMYKKKYTSSERAKSEEQS